MTFPKTFLQPIRLALSSAAAIAAVVVVFWPALSFAADIRLVMFERPFCEWCEAWNEEVGDAYAKTEEGRFAPLRRVQLNDPRPADLGHIQWPRFTPTFVMMVDGREVGRIRGYPGEDFFWGLIGDLIQKAKSHKKSS